MHSFSLPQSSNIFIALHWSPSPLEKPQRTSAEGKERGDLTCLDPGLLTENVFQWAPPHLITFDTSLCQTHTLARGWRFLLTGLTLKRYCNRALCSTPSPRGGLPYIKGGDACREISNEPLKGTNLGVA